LAKIARRESLLIERPPPPVKAKRNDEQREPDHRAGRRQSEPTRPDLAGELKTKKDEKAADHDGLSPEAGGAVNASAYTPAMIASKNTAHRAEGWRGGVSSVGFAAPFLYRRTHMEGMAWL
jgi:hypothetical protein